MLGSSGIVLKLFKSEARFPFFVRQVTDFDSYSQIIGIIEN